MIRPLTVATFLLAAGSGLYLYQSKHEVQLLDRTIERTVHDTAALREQSRLLSAEWTMLNDPERLRQFSDTYLSLRTISPSQFTSLADLDSRLPPPHVAEPPRGTEEAEPVAQAPLVSADAGADEDEGLPVPPIPTLAPPVAVASAARATADRRPADAASRIAVAGAGDQHAGARLADSHVDGHPLAAPPPRQVAFVASRPPLQASGALSGQPAAAPYRPAAVAARPAMAAAAPAPFPGSLLGMAHASMPPAPRPTPVSATYDAN